MLTAESLIAEWNPPSKDPFRKEGLAAFTAAGLPTPRHEDWKYTSLAGLKTLEPSEIGTAPVAPTAGPTVQFVDGRWILPETPPEGVLLSLSDTATPRVDDPLDALNTAFVGQVLTIAVNPGADVTLHLTFSQSGGRQHPRVVVRIGRSGRLVLLEQSVGSGAYLLNPVWEAFIAENAEWQHVRLLNDAAPSYHLASNHLELSRDARYRGTSVAVGGACTRSTFRTALSQGSSFHLAALALARTGQLHDHHLVIDHREPHSESRQHLKGVLDGDGRGVFTGKVIVRPGASKSDSDQSIRNLLLSDDAVANARPQLEIDTDDVKCAHGTTVGRLDDESLFYLRARGIPKLEARKLLTEAFARDVVDGIPHEPSRAIVETAVNEWLSGMHT